MLTLLKTEILSQNRLVLILEESRAAENETARYNMCGASEDQDSLSRCACFVQALEETTVENNKIEHEVALLRTKVHGEMKRSKSAPSLVR